MSYNRTILAGLVPIGFQSMTLSNSTAVAINSTCRGANVLDISVETNDVRYRADGTAPTLSTGVLLQSDITYRFEGYNGTSKLLFQRSTGSAVVQIMAYKHIPGRA